MQKFTNMPELLTYLLQAKHPDEIESQAVLAMHTVETTVQFQSFLGSHYPITATVIEARDSIALLNEWDKRVYEFSQLTVRLD